MTYDDPNLPVLLHNADFYMRGAIHRGVGWTLDWCETALDALDKHPDIAETFRESMLGGTRYNLQWLKETRDALCREGMPIELVGDDFTWSKTDERIAKIAERLRS